MQIAALRQLINYPKRPLQLAADFDQYNAAGSHIVDFIERRKQINEFVEKVKAYLENLKSTIASSTWHVKTFWNALTKYWSVGMPSH